MISVESMEILLNTTWLVLTVGAFLYWWPGKRKGRFAPRRYGSSFGLLALACAG